jgi:hypothetical protein
MISLQSVRESLSLSKYYFGKYESKERAKTKKIKRIAE